MPKLIHIIINCTQFLFQFPYFSCTSHSFIHNREIFELEGFRIRDYFLYVVCGLFCYVFSGNGKLVGVNLKYITNSSTHELKLKVIDEIRDRKESLTFLLMLQKVCIFFFQFAKKIKVLIKTPFK